MWNVYQRFYTARSLRMLPEGTEFELKLLGFVAIVIMIKMRQILLVRIFRNSKASKIMLCWLLCDAWLNNYCLNHQLKGSPVCSCKMLRVQTVWQPLSLTTSNSAQEFSNSSSNAAAAARWKRGSLVSWRSAASKACCFGVLPLLSSLSVFAPYDASSLMIARWLTRCIWCCLSFDGAAANERAQRPLLFTAAVSARLSRRISAMM